MSLLCQSSDMEHCECLEQSKGITFLMRPFTSHVLYGTDCYSSPLLSGDPAARVVLVCSRAQLVFLHFEQLHNLDLPFVQTRATSRLQCNV